MKFYCKMIRAAVLLTSFPWKEGFLERRLIWEGGGGGGGGDSGFTMLGKYLI